jgi:hypothetical protein
MKLSAALLILTLGAAEAFTAPSMTFAVGKKAAPKATATKVVAKAKPKAVAKPAATKVVAKVAPKPKPVVKAAPKPKPVVKAVVKPVPVKKVVVKKVVPKAAAPIRVVRKPSVYVSFSWEYICLVAQPLTFFPHVYRKEELLLPKPFQEKLPLIFLMVLSLVMSVSTRASYPPELTAWLTTSTACSEV